LRPADGFETIETNEAAMQPAERKLCLAGVG